MQYVRIVTASIILLMASCNTWRPTGTFKLKGSYSINEYTQANKSSAPVICGFVYDKRNDQILPYAVVSAGDVCSTCDTTGHYCIKSAIGLQTIKAYYAGCSELLVKDVNVKAQDSVVINFYLGFTAIE